MPDPIAQGEVLQDICKRQWILGPSIGKGGFGEIYSARPSDNSTKDYKYVIKIEPHENGPLFVEMHFYNRCAREKDVVEFKQMKKLKHLGMPIYIASGSHTYKNEKYRFIVMEKFAPQDIWKLFVMNDKRLSPICVYRLAMQMLDVLEYIHSKGYIHGDIKGANILLSEKDANCAFLVDFGLAGKFTTEPQYVPNPKRMHNGTIEYLSRDAHHGVQTRRGDIEILAYNMIHWLTGTLPWEGNSNPESVQQEKENFMDNITKFSTCLDSEVRGTIVELLTFINSIKHDEAPDYAKVHKILLKGLKSVGGTESSPLVFTSPKKRKSATNLDSVASSNKRGKASKTKNIQVPSTADNMNGNEAPTSSMNAEEMRIATLIREKPARQRKPKKKDAPNVESNTNGVNENEAPTSSLMNSDELRELKVKKTPIKKHTKAIPTDAGDSPPRSHGKPNLLNALHEEVRRSPRNRDRKRPDYIN
ncbi:serine/threonine-protein kinase VRK1 [Atheta coriaria]|uniref:serine/threonine-protein kinase VRK1 n=1 Tax=Dalotia coriaria TaxID=877792 RepID=UPI0031F41045